MVAIAAKVLATAHRDRFQSNHEVDLAYSVPGLGRFRCNAFQQRGTTGMVFRVIPVQVQSRENLMLPAVLKKIASEERGLVLVTGTTGCGKTTTLAAMLDDINETRTCHVMTVEDPIEYLHRDKKSIFCQREIGVDTNSFSQALRSALRQDPDVILVGEMRDFETIETALHAAETGHLVFSTLHTLDATETISRIVAVFPPHQQKQIRLQLASVLKAVISQRLLPKSDDKGRVPAVEVMINTAFIKDCIVDQDKTNLIQRGDLPGHVAVRDADVRPVDLSALRAEADHQGSRAPLGDESGRLQAQDAGHLDHGRRGDGRYGAQRDGAPCRQAFVGRRVEAWWAADHPVHPVSTSTRHRWQPCAK